MGKRWPQIGGLGACKDGDARIGIDWPFLAPGEVGNATGDAGALMELTRFTDQWPGYETVYLYQGERLIAVRANPQLGFARDAMILDDRAA